MTACFWAGCRIGLRCNTRADRLKLSIFVFLARPNSGHFFFGNAKGNSKASSPLDEPSHPSSVPAINILRLTRSQPTTAALIFWRQLVRHSFKLATSSERVQAAPQKILSAA
jgi:hypothetical protein